jgi:hypothetical protein
MDFKICAKQDLEEKKTLPPVRRGKIWKGGKCARSGKNLKKKKENGERQRDKIYCI